VSVAFPGIEPPPPAPPVDASAVVLYRDGPDGREVFLVRRGVDRRFAGGFHAFPGGRLDPEDAQIPVAGASGEAAALVACAVRELFEETGILRARGAESLTVAEREGARGALLEGALGFADLVAQRRLVLDAALLVPAGRWITPAFLPLRYDARLFLVPLAPGETPVVWPGELSGGALVPVREALRRWSRGELLLHPPNLNALRALDRDGPPDLALLREPPGCDDAFVSHRIEFQEGFFLCALRTPTLPPATHTNAWVVPCDGGVAVVDPGAPEAADQPPLFDLLDALAAEGRPPRAVWLTHAHPDHVGSAAAVALRYGVPVVGHARAAGAVPGVAFVAAREGDLLGGRFRVLETPGHAPEHLVFLDEETAALVCGDVISTLSTIVIDPPEGDMAEYERQLERLRALAPRTLYPAHGTAVPGAVEKLRWYRAHRREREVLVAAALAAGGTLGEITRRAYLDTPTPYLPVAERSCLAVLEKLARRGRARLEGSRWRSP
jgi:glyoxylase-like metal-dependent hydrolase (beta-lactamase superfamily II)/8-oxo-dGTP pyrophosphatase MutT (NUDIX family)